MGYGICQPTREDAQMKPLLIFAGILGVFLIVAVGAFKVILGGGTADYASLTGAELYGKLCQQCHGRRGLGGAGNSYAGKRDYWDKESLLAYIANPPKVKRTMPHLRNSKKAMPAIPLRVPQEARERLVIHIIEMMENLE